MPKTHILRKGPADKELSTVLRKGPADEEFSTVLQRKHSYRCFDDRRKAVGTAASQTYCSHHFEKAEFAGFGRREFPALTAYIEAASLSSSKVTESGSGGTGALDNTKTVGTERRIEADRNGGRDGLIRGSRKSFADVVDKGCVYGHGHEHEQSVGLSSLPSPRQTKYRKIKCCPSPRQTKT